MNIAHRKDFKLNSIMYEEKFPSLFIYTLIDKKNKDFVIENKEALLLKFVEGQNLNPKSFKVFLEYLEVHGHLKDYVYLTHFEKLFRRGRLNFDFISVLLKLDYFKHILSTHDFLVTLHDIDMDDGYKKNIIVDSILKNGLYKIKNKNEFADWFDILDCYKNNDLLTSLLTKNIGFLENADYNYFKPNHELTDKIKIRLIEQKINCF